MRRGNDFELTLVGVSVNAHFDENESILRLTYINDGQEGHA